MRQRFVFKNLVKAKFVEEGAEDLLDALDDPTFLAEILETNFVNAEGLRATLATALLVDKGSLRADDFLGRKERERFGALLLQFDAHDFRELLERIEFLVVHSDTDIADDALPHGRAGSPGLANLHRLPRRVGRRLDSHKHRGPA